jgi:hypothetical protein
MPDTLAYMLNSFLFKYLLTTKKHLIDHCEDLSDLMMCCDFWGISSLLSKKRYEKEEIM